MPKFSPIASYLICKNLTLPPPYSPIIHKNTKRPSPWSVEELQACVSPRTIERVFVLFNQQGMVIPPAEPHSI